MYRAYATNNSNINLSKEPIQISFSAVFCGLPFVLAKLWTAIAFLPSKHLLLPFDQLGVTKPVPSHVVTVIEHINIVFILN